MNKVNKVVLANGLTLIHSAVERAPVVALVAWVNAGSGAETAEEFGVAHICEHNVFKGTKRRGVGQISEEAENAGGDINAWTSYDETVFHLTLPVSEADLGMDLLADMVQNATIDQGELDRELEVIVEELRRSLDNPIRKLSDEIFNIHYAGHNYGHPIIGTEESIRAQTSASVRHFIAKHYIPQNITVVVVGKISLHEAIELTNKHWGHWHPEVICEQHGPAPEDRALHAAETIIRIQTSDQEEAHLAMTWAVPEFAHEDVPALDILDTILGGGLSSRLVQTLRDKQNLVNSCGSFCFTPVSEGLFMANASMNAGKILPTLKSMVKQITLLMNKEVSQDELDKARFILQSDTWRKQETAEGLARDYGNFQMMAGNPEYDYVYNALLDQVTPAKLRQVARKYLQLPTALVVSAPKGAKLPDESQISTIINGLKLPNEAAGSSARQDSHGWYVYDLPGGGHLVEQVDTSAPVVACMVAHNGGQRFEQPGEYGIETFLANMLGYATKNHSHEELACLIDELAAGIAGNSGRNSILIQGSFLASNFQSGLPLLLESLWQPSFDPEGVELVRRLILEKIRTKADKPATLATEAMMKGLYGDHPLGAPRYGLAEDIKRVTPAMLKKHHQKMVLGNAPFISVVGDFDPEETAKVIIAHYKKYCRQIVSLPEIPAVQQLTVPQEIFVPADKEQVHIRLGFLGPDMQNKGERWAMTLFCAAIGGMSGRLFMQLRDVESLAYTVSGNYITGPTSGYITFYIATAPDKVAQAKEGLIRELNKLLTEGLTQDELDKARRVLLGESLISQQYMEARASEMCLDGIYGQPYDSYLNLSQALKEITLDDIQKTAHKYLNWDRAVWAMVGDTKNDR